MQKEWKIITIISLSIISFSIVYLIIFNVIENNQREKEISSFNIKKAKVDDRNYDFIKLKNEIDCTVVSDPISKVSAASLTVKVGSWADPENYEGIAHFLEHALLMKSKNYPEIDGFFKFIDENSGSFNAFTEETSTTFYFEVKNSAFSEGLKRFSDFFKSVDLDKNLVNDEINAVDHEFKKNFDSDYYKEEHVVKELSSKKYPFGKFSVGNRDTLNKPDIFEKVSEFYAQNYSANLMKLSLVSNLELNSIKEMANKYFSDIENKNLKQIEYKEFKEIFPIELSRKIVKIKTIQKNSKLTLRWPIPSYDHLKDSNPLTIILKILNKKSPGSLISYLKINRLAFSAFFTIEKFDKTLNIIYFKAELTPQGLQKFSFIINITNEFINYLKTCNINKKYFESVKEFNQIDFDNSQKESAEDLSIYLSNNLWNFRAEEVLFGPYKFENYLPEIYNEIFGLLNISNSLKILSSSQFQNLNNEEKLYKTKYELEDFINDSNGEKPKFMIEIFDFRHKFPNDFHLKSLQSKEDLEISRLDLYKHRSIAQLFYKFTTSYKIPEIIINLKFHLKKDSNYQLKKIILSYIFSMIYQIYSEDIFEDIDEYLVSATIEFESTHLLICGHGISNGVLTNLPKLSSNLLRFIHLYKDKDGKTFLMEWFSLLIDKLKEEIEDSIFKNGKVLFQDMISTMRISNFKFDHLKMLEEIKNVIVSDYLNFHENLLQETYIEGLAIGNIYRNEFENLVSKIVEEIYPVKENILDFKNMYIQNFNVYPVEKEITIYDKVKNPESPNNYVLIDYQVENTLENIFILNLFEKYISPQFFETLRTKNQMGYIANVSSNELNKRIFLSFFVLTSKNPKLVINQIQEFISDKLQLKTLNAEIFQNLINSSIHDYEKPFNNIFEEFNFYLNEINSHQYNFDIAKKARPYYSKLSLTDLKNFIRINFITVKRTAAFVMVSQNNFEEFKTSIADNSKNFFPPTDIAKFNQESEDNLWMEIFMKYDNKFHQETKIIV